MNRLRLAVAGGRKTQSIIDDCCKRPAGHRILVLTYTRTGQQELRDRLALQRPGANVTVLGWFAFLMQHWVRPFLPLLFDGLRLRGLDFEGEPHKSGQGYPSSNKPARYLNSKSQVYRRFLSELAFKVHQAADKAPVQRLQRMYDDIFIDEVQDLAGYDLEILDLLFKSRCSVTMVGDLRQSLLSTNAQDQKNRQYRGLQMMKWFDEREAKGMLTVTACDVTWRSHQGIADFADQIFASQSTFPRTVSKQTKTTGHDGVFAVRSEDVEDYITMYNPVFLRHNKKTLPPDGVPAMNFGESKGTTHDRVLIQPTQPIRDWISRGKPLALTSACGLYVAVTRAVHSVAFVLNEHPPETMTLWDPSR